MYETIAYIPTVMAYIFVFLLIIILGFIIIYISHKIYTYVYDYMPLPQMSATSIQRRIKSRKIRNPVNNDNNFNVILESQIPWKTNTALRILVSVRPCFLASVVYEIDESHKEGPSAMTEAINTQVKKLTKYFDSLSVIPTEPHILHCYNDGSPTITYLANGDVMIRP